jgi:hypothetical protein
MPHQPALTAIRMRIHALLVPPRAASNQGLSCLLVYLLLPTALQAADAVVAIAGADGSLPGALAGLIDAPVIALPTSQGNSAGLGGLSGLVAAVSSCNLGVSAVGIDQAPAAAAMAARMLRMTAARVEKLTAATAAAAAAAPPAVPAVPVAHVNGNGNGMSAVNNVVPTMLDSLSLTPALAGAAK